MNVDELIQKLKITEEQNIKLAEELQATKAHLKKYTAPTSSKIYYEKHKEAHKQRVKEYKEKINYKPTPEQQKSNQGSLTSSYKQNIHKAEKPKL